MVFADYLLGYTVRLVGLAVYSRNKEPAAHHYAAFEGLVDKPLIAHIAVEIRSCAYRGIAHQRAVDILLGHCPAGKRRLLEAHREVGLAQRHFHLAAAGENLRRLLLKYRNDIFPGASKQAALADFHGALKIEVSGNAQVHIRRVVICVVDVVQQLIGDERYALRGACDVVAHRIVPEHIAVQLHADAPGGAVEVHRYLLRDYAALLLDVLRGEIGVLNEIQQYLKILFEVRGTAEVVTRAVVGSSGVAGSAGLGKPCEGFLFR